MHVKRVMFSVTSSFTCSLAHVAVAELHEQEQRRNGSNHVAGQSGVRPVVADVRRHGR